MNLGINKEEANLIYDSLKYFFKHTKYPELLLDLYPGVDLDSIFTQLHIIKEIGDEPMLEEWKGLITNGTSRNI
jgi:hypothetical protein